MNLSKLNIYQINTLQKFNHGDVELTEETTRKVNEAHESDQQKLVRKLVLRLSAYDPIRFGRHVELLFSSLPIPDSNQIQINLEFRGVNDEQKSNLTEAIEHSMKYCVFYLNVPGMYCCNSRLVGSEVPSETISLLKEVTAEFLDDHFGDTIKTRKFSGVRNPIDFGPETLRVRRIPKAENLGDVHGLISSTGIVKSFDPLVGRLEFEDNRGDTHNIQFDSDSFISYEHELYYHAVQPRFNHQINIFYRIIESRKELITLESEPFLIPNNLVQLGNT